MMIRVSHPPLANYLQAAAAVLKQTFFHTQAGSYRCAAAATIKEASPLQPPSPSSSSSSTSSSLPVVGDFRTNLIGMSLAQLEQTLQAKASLPRFRAKQVADWLYAKGARDFSDMSNLSKEVREKLQRTCRISYGNLIKEEISQDQTRKFLLGFPSAKAALLSAATSPSAAQTSPSSPTTAAAALPQSMIECVYIPMGSVSSRTAPKEGAVCVSSQVGCSLSCSFCSTGAMDKSKLRNLTTAEIVSQVLLVKQQLGDFAPAAASSSTSSSITTPNRAVTNVVMMGQGEPLYNYRNVRGALDLLTSHPRAGGIGLGMGRPRITLSTSGVAPALQQLAEDFEGNISLAISLHAVTDQLRDELVPLNKTYNLSVLMEAVKRYQEFRSNLMAPEGNSEGSTKGRRRITFEYVMLRGVNDSPAEARQMVRLLHGINSLVNLIPFNPWEGSKYETSYPTQIQAFAQVLQEAGVACTVRGTRGQDINAACGQLASKHQQQQQRASL